MARPSTKKVTRAAMTGGGRTKGGARPWVYWLVMGLVVVLGTAGVVVSRDQRLAELASSDTLTAPQVGKDHWHAAYGIYVCDTFVPVFTEQRDPEGIHTHADGVIHIHPLVRRAAGKNAQLGKFFDAVNLDLSDNEVETIEEKGKQTYREGDDECEGKPAIMQLKVKGREKVITTDIEKFRFSEDRMVMTIAFAPEGAEIPLPPSEPNLDNLSDVDPVPGSTVPGDPTATTVAPGTEGATTVPPADATATTAPPGDSATTTAAP
ncbi:MAG TPA: hypothetical protein VF230_11890 [Acidimicrobiales bacterium]